MAIINELFANVFPTHVGMNRKYEVTKKEYRRIPHTRGDEPLKKSIR